MEGKRVHIYAEDMKDEMCASAIELCNEAFAQPLVRGNVFGAVATHIRLGFDKQHPDKKDGKGWNCVVGRSFGAYVTHEIKTYVYFTVAGVYVLLWRA